MAESSTPVPGNTCLVHGSYVGSACPVCTTGGNIPTNQTVRAGEAVTPQGDEPQVRPADTDALIEKALYIVRNARTALTRDELWVTLTQPQQSDPLRVVERALSEAADALARQREDLRVSDLESEHYQTLMEQYMERAERAEAQVEALREAMQWARQDSGQLVGLEDPFGSQGPPMLVGANAYFAFVDALEALAPLPPPQEERS